MSDAPAPAVGVVGLGAMGRPIAESLLRAGHAVVVTSRSPAPVAAVAAAGATAAGSPAEVAGTAPVLVLSLPDAAAVREVLFGPGGVVAAGAGGVVVDTTTLAPEEAQAIGAELAAHGVGYLDAPVSGGPTAAASGTLSVMVGGDADDLARARDPIAGFGATVVHCGGLGAGQVAKAVNQLIVLATMGAVSEALVLAERSGADVARVREALLGGYAQSRILEVLGPRMLAREFTPGGRARFHLKDVAAVGVLAAATGTATPVFDAAAGQLARLLEGGGGDLDHSAIVTVVDGTAGEAAR